MRLAVAIICIAALAGCAAPSTDTDAATTDTDRSDPFASIPPASSSPAAITPTSLPPPPPSPPQTFTGFRLVATSADGTPVFQTADGAKNPTLLVPAGEEITIDLVRGGELHAFTVNGVAIIGAGTDDVRGSFRAPESGSVEYDCPIHPGTMRGTIQVA